MPSLLFSRAWALTLTATESKSLLLRLDLAQGSATVDYVGNPASGDRQAFTGTILQAASNSFVASLGPSARCTWSVGDTPVSVRCLRQPEAQGIEGHSRAAGFAPLAFANMDHENAAHDQQDPATAGGDQVSGEWCAWRDSNPRPMASEATTLSG